MLPVVVVAHVVVVAAAAVVEANIKMANQLRTARLLKPLFTTSLEAEAEAVAEAEAWSCM